MALAGQYWDNSGYCTAATNMDLALLPASLPASSAGLLLLCSALSSLITASLGAGGGMLLLVLMALVIPPEAIIPVHGLIQLGSNSGRAALTWHHIDWRLIGWFVPGMLLGATAGGLLLVNLPPHLWQLAIALFVLYLSWGPPLPALALGPAGIVVAAALTSFLSLFVGATGPLVAAFVKHVHAERFRTVATFAAAMVLQHAPKALVFTLSGFLFVEWLPFIAAMIAAGFVGTWTGLHLLRKLSNRQFALALKLLLTVLACRLLWSAAQVMAAVAGAQ